MICLSQLAQGFGRKLPATLVEELIDLARQVQGGLPSFYWLGPYHSQQQRLRRAARQVSRELEGGLAHSLLDTLVRLRRRLRAARRALLAQDWSRSQRHLQRFCQDLEGLDSLSQRVEESAGLDWRT